MKINISSIVKEQTLNISAENRIMELIYTGSLMQKGRIIIFILAVFSLSITLVSCLKGDDPLPEIPEDDGIYIKGKATAFDHFDRNGMLQPAKNLSTGITGQGLFEIFLAVRSGPAGFNIIEVINRQQAIYGPVTGSDVVVEGENGQITGTIQKGVFGRDAGVFTVQEDGIYHIILDKVSETYVISRVSDISVYGSFGGGPWTDTDLYPAGGFDVSNMTYELSGLELGEGEFRFRYGHGDRIEVSGGNTVVSTSFGGEMSGQIPGLELTMVAGGSNYILPGSGVYSITVTWTVGEGFAAQLTETGMADYPEKLFMTGDGISTLSGEEAWSWELNDFELIPVHSRAHLFWKIVWMTGEGAVRFAPARIWDSDFGKEGEPVNGFYGFGDQDVPVPAAEGFYMVVVNLITRQISISQPVVYLIGDAVGSWDALNPEFRFTVDNSYGEISLLKRLKEGSVRMYAWHEEWFSNWWNAEFNIYDGEITYRGNGPNLEPTIVIAGFFTIKLKFRTGEAVIELCGCS